MGVSESPPIPIVGERRDSGVAEGGRRCSWTEASLQKWCKINKLQTSSKSAWLHEICKFAQVKGKGKVHPWSGTVALYELYGP